MTELWVNSDSYRATVYKNEAELEKTILRLKDRLFGVDRIYLDVKRKIGNRGGQRNIPDGYLIDLRRSPPLLYVIENELQSHDPLRHIAVQLLQFSLSFESNRFLVKQILMDALDELNDERQKCERYIAAHPDFRNLDHLLESLVTKAGFRALVIIDSVPDDLEKVLLERFRFPVEVMQLKPYKGKRGTRAFSFEPFLAEIESPSPTSGSTTRPPTNTAELDTIVVPARPDGFAETFLGEDRWYAIRVNASMRDQIKWIAAYQVAPISAITHVAPVRNIEPWEDSGKVVLNFAASANQIEPIRLAGGRGAGIQSPRYTTKARLDSAKNLTEL
ncbi:MAG: hypothetical protein F4Y67_02140 [Chloroflexi bacterium]|nr:hypothetical protein [Chloroflexota bacterium]